MNASKSGEARHPIGVVARKTGLSADVIRAWEQRYGAVEPERTEGGHRLYSEADVRRLLLLGRAVDAGHRIGAIADLGESELVEVVRSLSGSVPVSLSPSPSPNGDDARPDPTRVVSTAMAAMSAVDAAGLRAALQRAAVLMEPMEYMERVLVPFLEELGRWWERGTVTPAHEHVASTVVRDVLSWLTEVVRPAEGGPVLAIGAPTGQRHEFGAMLVAVVAGVAGWSALLLGADLPAGDMATVARQARARAVALSVVYLEDAPGVVAELKALRSSLPKDVRLVAGGRRAGELAQELESLGVAHASDLRSLLTLLREWAPERAA